MEYRQLGRSDLKVSALCLGTMTFGEQNTEAEGHEQMDYALAEGINFFDTAEMYPIAPKAETAGRTEEIIGTWMKSRKARDKVIIATKANGRSEVMTWLRDPARETRHDRAQLTEAVEGSLRRLRTDTIDLYQLHWPDRPMRVFGGLGFEAEQGDMEPIEDILGTLGELVDQGKIRHVGLSNETPWGTMRFLDIAARCGLPRVQSIQNAYNLLNRTYETGLSEVTHHESVSLLAYSPLAQGYLTGKYQDGAMPPGTRKVLFDRLQRYETPGAPAAVDKYLALAREAGLDPGQMAIQFVTTRPFVTSNIIGATSMAQLRTDIASTAVEIDAELSQRIEDIHLIHSNPCP